MIIVCGVDASGTSAIVKVLHSMGVLFPGPYTFDPSVENVQARVINDTIMLGLTGAKWGRFPSYRELTQFECEDVSDIPNINWKDPRAMVTLPLWRDRNPRVIWVKRSPANVASSWLKRKALYPRPGYDTRQQIYDFIAKMEGYLFISLGRYDIPWHVTCYEDWYKEKNKGEVQKVLDFCGKSVPDDRITDAIQALKMPENY